MEYTVYRLVEHIVVVLKVAKAIDELHRAQRLNYLKRLAPLPAISFDKPRLEIKRIVLAL
jgi:hypothetical protein